MRLHESASKLSTRAPGEERASWPPAPHDPRERELVLTLSGWQVRLFADARFAYFVPRGLWHVQLWHETSGVSVLTRSSLTKGAYEVYPIAGWKRQARSYEALCRLVEEAHAVALFSCDELAWVERRLVRDVVRDGVRSRGTRN